MHSRDASRQTACGGNDSPMNHERTGREAQTDNSPPSLPLTYTSSIHSTANPPFHSPVIATIRLSDLLQEYSLQHAQRTRPSSPVQPTMSVRRKLLFPTQSHGEIALLRDFPSHCLPPLGHRGERVKSAPLPNKTCCYSGGCCCTATALLFVTLIT